VLENSNKTKFNQNHNHYRTQKHGLDLTNKDQVPAQA
jgi:hypothetical protein